MKPQRSKPNFSNSRMLASFDREISRDEVAGPLVHEVEEAQIPDGTLPRLAAVFSHPQRPMVGVCPSNDSRRASTVVGSRSQLHFRVATAKL
nr:hypothetical protein [uncultured Roseateles sp.]